MTDPGLSWAGERVTAVTDGLETVNRLLFELLKTGLLVVLLTLVAVFGSAVVTGSLAGIFGVVP